VKRQNPAIQITQCCLHRGSQARGQVLRFEGKIHFRRGKIFVFIVCLKHFFLGTTNFGGLCPLCLRTWGKPWWSKFYQRNCQKRWKTVSTLSSLLKQETWISRIFCCYAMKWDQKINHCYFIRLCVGFHGEKFCKALRALPWNKSVRIKSEQPSPV